MTDLSPNAEHLLRAAKEADIPSAQDKARIKAAVVAAAAGAGVAAVGTAHAAATSTVMASGWKVIIGGLLMTAAVTGTWAVSTTLGESADEPAVATAPVEAPPPIVEDKPEFVAPEPSVEVSEPEPSEPPVVKRAPVKAAPKPRPIKRVRHVDAPVSAPPAASVTASTLAQEAALIAQVRVALRDGRSEDALTLVDTHAEKFPQGSLLEERWAAKALALCQLERWTEADAARQALIAIAPRSPHLLRICNPKNQTP